METETQAEGTQVSVRPHSHLNGHLVLTTGPYRERRLVVTKDELRAIVQQAFDQHGITPQLWTDGSTESTADGLCACPFPESCSDAAQRAHNEGVRR